MRRIKLFGILLFVLIQRSEGQLSWVNVDSAYRPLPENFHVFRSQGSPGRSPFIAYYASVVLADRDLLFTTQTGAGNRYTPAQFYRRELAPLLIVNGGFFNFDNNDNLSLVIRNGKILSYNITSLKGTGPDSSLYYYPTRAAIGISRSRKADVAWVFTDSSRHRPYAFENGPVIAKGSQAAPSIYDLNDVDWKWWQMRVAIGGGPALIHDGKIWITSREEQMFGNTENEKHPRTAMGYTADGRLVILVIQGRFPGRAEGASLPELAQIMKNLGCYEALNLDGGGSSCMLIRGKETIEPCDKEGQRPVPSVFIVKAAR